MRNLFNMDNGLFRALGRVADLMILNVIFIICCIPIVTIGPSLTAMYYVTLKIADNEEGYIARGFFKSFRQNFRQALIIWLLMLLLGLILAADLFILRGSAVTAYKVLRVLILATTVVYFMAMLYVFPTLARFDNSIRVTMRNALLMAIIDFPRTLLMLVISVAAVFITLYNGYTFWYGLLFWIMLGFATIAYVNSRFFSKIFKKYMPEDKDEPVADDEWELPETNGADEEAPKISDMTAGNGETPKTSDAAADGGETPKTSGTDGADEEIPKTSDMAADAEENTDTLPERPE